MTERTRDIAIVGAGPAGLATAMHLVRLDPAWAGRVIILGKGAHPRPKLCAGAITRLGLDQLSLLGLTLDVPFVEIEELRFQYRNRSVRVRGRPVIVIAWRQGVDARLASKARGMGIEI